MDNWKKIATVVGVVVLVGVIVVFLTGSWQEIVNAALKTIQDVIGIDPAHQFQIPTGP